MYFFGVMSCTWGRGSKGAKKGKAVRGERVGVGVGVGVVVRLL